MTKIANDFISLNSQDFGEFLLKSSIVPQGKEIFFVHWVKKFLKTRASLPELVWHEQLPLFLDQLQAANTIEPWQLKQAEQAIGVYFTNYLGKLSAGPQSPAEIETGTKKSLSSMQALDNYQELLRLKHYARSTERTYLGWIKSYFSYCRKHQPQIRSTADLTQTVAQDYLAHLALSKNVSATTQNLAFNSLLSFYRLVLQLDLTDLKNNVRARTSQKLPVVFSVEEVFRLLTHVEGTSGLMLKLIYGGGLRVNECCRLRIQDIDFSQELIIVRDGKGGKDRTTILPAVLIEPLRLQLENVLTLHDKFLAEGHGTVWLPRALAVKYPNAATARGWQWLFPAQSLSVDPRIWRRSSSSCL